ncbi:hypothetical protein BJ546DRAFT_195717 [Cryomyces antarcticus]
MRRPHAWFSTMLACAGAQYTMLVVHISPNVFCPYSRRLSYHTLADADRWLSSRLSGQPCSSTQASGSRMTLLLCYINSHDSLVKASYPFVSSCRPLEISMGRIKCMQILLFRCYDILCSNLSGRVPCSPWRCAPWTRNHVCYATQELRVTLRNTESFLVFLVDVKTVREVKLHHEKCELYPYVGLTRES